MAAATTHTAATTSTNVQRLRDRSAGGGTACSAATGRGSDGASSATAGISPVNVGVNGAVGSVGGAAASPFDSG